MKILVYLASLIITICCIAVGLEIGLRFAIPDSFRGYLIDVEDSKVTWVYGPYEPGQSAKGFNTPVSVTKPPDTIRIITLGASGAEGWLTAKTVFEKYGQNWGSSNLSSYSRSIEFILNSMAGSSTPRVEVINLGIAAYNIVDVVRMLKDSLRLDPDLYLIQIGGNETWTAERSTWSRYISSDIPYLYTELGLEILTGIQSEWGTQSTGGNAFNPLALLGARPLPVLQEPEGRDAGVQERLANYADSLEGFGDYLQEQLEVPALILLPSQNIGDYKPFGSMARAGTSAEDRQRLNDLLLEAMASEGAEARSRYEQILALDDGIAEANFQMGQIHLGAGDVATAREYLWKANDRDFVLKRLPSGFHRISRDFVEQRDLPHFDVMGYLAARSELGIAGYDLLDDDVHPNRESQFALAGAIVDKMLAEGMLQQAGYAGDPRREPDFADYNAEVGYDETAAGIIAYVKAAHNYTTFGRYRRRLLWDPRPEELLDPILDDLKIANAYAPSRQSRLMATTLNLYLGRREAAARVIESFNCPSDPDEAAMVTKRALPVAQQLLGRPKPALREQLQIVLREAGCAP